MDLDIHPNGTSMASSGKDKHVRFWTYPGAGCLLNDCFHGGQVNVQDEEFLFNQSHKQSATETEDLLETLRVIETKQKREGEDVFTREDS
jgi:hypothetical protein